MNNAEHTPFENFRSKISRLIKPAESTTEFKNSMGQTPPEHHKKIIKMLLQGLKGEYKPSYLASIPEGSYVTASLDAYGGPFISCPAILIETTGQPTKCLHVTFQEFINAIETSQFTSNINFRTFLEDIQKSSKVTALLSAATSSNESRSTETKILRESIQALFKRSNKSIDALEIQEIAGNSFQLVIDKDNVSAWNGEKFLKTVF